MKRKAISPGEPSAPIPKLDTTPHTPLIFDVAKFEENNQEEINEEEINEEEVLGVRKGEGEEYDEDVQFQLQDDEGVLGDSPTANDDRDVDKFYDADGLPFASTQAMTPATHQTVIANKRLRQVLDLITSPSYRNATKVFKDAMSQLSPNEWWEIARPSYTAQAIELINHKNRPTEAQMLALP